MEVKVPGSSSPEHIVNEKKSLNRSQTVLEIPKQVNLAQIKQIQDELSAELNDLKS